MVNLEKQLANMPPEERIKFLKRLKELDEEKIKLIEEKKKQEIEQLKSKSKVLENELSESINESIEELTEIESKKFETKDKNFEETILQQQNPQKAFDYNSLVDKIKSENTIDKSNAYNLMKQVTENQTSYPGADSGVSYESLQKIKSVVDKMNEDNDDFGYKQRMTSILNQAFEKIKQYDGDY